jgi:hypothetical protein
MCSIFIPWRISWLRISPRSTSPENTVIAPHVAKPRFKSSAFKATDPSTVCWIQSNFDSFLCRCSIVKGVMNHVRRWQTGTVIVWYPIKNNELKDALLQRCDSTRRRLRDVCEEKIRPLRLLKKNTVNSDKTDGDFVSAPRRFCRNMNRRPPRIECFPSFQLRCRV